MSLDQNEFVLGKDVTTKARAKDSQGTTVLSVRVPIDEMVMVERACRSIGKTPSQIVREAIHQYIQVEAASFQSTVTISVQGGMTFSTGRASQSSLPSRVSQLPEAVEAVAYRIRAGRYRPNNSTS